MRPTGLRPALLLVCAATALGLYAGDASAQWKWRDKNGRVTVSDLPPPRDVPERDILQRPPAAAPVPAPIAAPIAAPAGTAEAASAPAVATPASAPARVDPELERRRQAAEQAQAHKQREEEARLAEQRAENCRAARGQLAALESGQRMVRMNDKGEREFLDDAQRAAQTQRARAVIASECR